MKTNLFTKLSGVTRKALFVLKKHSPEILAVSGVIGTVTAAVLACRATTKLGGILEETKENIGKVNQYDADSDFTEDYTHEDAEKDKIIIYVQTGIKIAHLYAPAVMLGAASLTGLLASNNILRHRNAALASAYAVIDGSYKAYRQRVREYCGDETEKEIRYGVKKVDIFETIADEKGKEETVTKCASVVNVNKYSDYARFFDEGSPYWEKDSEYNLMFLRQQQAYANDLLRANGRLFLNEVYDMLGIPRTKAGQVVGWVYDEKNPVGDNYVDFNIYNAYREANRDFVNGYERCILLDFNVDGNVWETM